jgi:hypothetical protein
MSGEGKIDGSDIEKSLISDFKASARSVVGARTKIELKSGESKDKTAEEEAPSIPEKEVFPVLLSKESCFVKYGDCLIDSRSFGKLIWPYFNTFKN